MSCVPLRFPPAKDRPIVNRWRSFLGRKPPFKRQVLAQCHPRRVVDVEHLHGPGSGPGRADQERVLPAEVPVPLLRARVEQRIQLAAESSGQIWPLGPIAFRARPTKRVRVVLPAVLLGDHMLDMEGEEIVIVFVQAAVLTAAARPLPDEGPERGIHQSPWEWASSWRAFDFRMATKVL